MILHLVQILGGDVAEVFVGDSGDTAGDWSIGRDLISRPSVSRHCNWNCNEDCEAAVDDAGRNTEGLRNVFAGVLENRREVGKGPVQVRGDVLQGTGRCHDLLGGIHLVDYSKVTPKEDTLEAVVYGRSVGRCKARAADFQVPAVRQKTAQRATRRRGEGIFVQKYCSRKRRIAGQFLDGLVD